MKHLKSVLMTTHVDRQGDRFTKGALESAVRQVQVAYIPMGIEHDPRIPPVGRTVDAELQQLPDGEWALVGLTEIFEPGDDLPFTSEDREIRIRRFSDDSLTIVYDRSYRGAAELTQLAGYSGDLPIRIEQEEKKALEPLSVLTLALAFAATAFAAGFLNKAGSDTWDYIKPRLASLLARRRENDADFLFVVEIQHLRDDGVFSIQCVLSSPSEEVFEEFWANGLPALEETIARRLNVGRDVRRVVLHYIDGRLVPGFALRKDGVPLALEILASQDDTDK